MDSQDRKNSTGSTGHEIHGVHLCLRCGWPFPNPHPSARHRRSHKKVCGKIEGYKLSESENARFALSDDGHASDEDHHTPSPIPKAERKEFDSSGGVGEKSNRSEYEVFTDAVSDFSDSGVSPSLDERFESVSDKSVEKGKVDDLNRNQLLKSDETTKTTEQPNDPTSSSLTCKLEYAVDRLESTTTPSDTTSEAVSVGFTGLQSDPIKSESQTDIITDNINEDGDRKMQLESLSAREIVDAKGEKGKVYLERSESVALDSEEGKTSDLNVIVMDKEEKLCDKLDTEVVKHEVYTQNERTENMDSFVEVNKDADSATDINGESDLKLIQIKECKSENGQEQMHFLSANLPGVDNPEIIIEDFKDHKYIQSKLPVDLSSAKIARPIEAVDEGNIVECFSAHSVKPVGSMPSSSVPLSDSSAVEDNLKGDGYTATSRNVETCGLEVREVTSGEDIQTNCSTQGLQSRPFDSSKNDLSEYSPINGSDTISIVSSTNEEVKQKTNVHGDENAKICDIGKSDKGVAIGNERSDKDSEDVSCVESKSTPGHADMPFAPKDDQTAMALVEDNNHCEEKYSSMLLDAGNGSGEVGTLGKLTNNGEAMNGYSMQSLNPTDFLTSDRSAKHPISEEIAPLPVDSESLKQKSAEETSCAGDVDMESESVDAAGMGDELNHDENIVKMSENQNKPTSIEQESMPAGHESLNGTSADVENKCTSDEVSTLNSVAIDSVSKEPEAPPSDSEVLNKSSGTVDDTPITNGERVSGISFEPLQDEPDDKLTKQKDGNSSVFISGASSSPTESLEGNWGSVLSSQSDVTAIAETNQKNKTIAKEGHPHKSDDFEAPSFGTLVQSIDEVDQKVSASEIKIAQNAKQPKFEALPQGWFPSITNVVNESEGRKKNEEIIAKVTNWSSGKQHSPLKNLLTEARSPNPKQVPAANQKDETSTKDNGREATTVNSTLGSGAPNKEMEWNSPARYPTEIKKEKKKGKPYWVPFVCCSSVHSDL